MNGLLLISIIVGVAGLVFLLLQDLYDHKVTFRVWGPPANYRFTYQFFYCVLVIVLAFAQVAAQ